jgi:hypothetical protein
MCGHKFKLRYLEKIRRESGPAAKRGIAIHAVAKEAHKRQMLDLKKWDGAKPLFENLPGSPESVVEAKDIAAAQFEAAWGWGNIFSAKDKELGDEAKIKAHAKDAAVDLSALYVEKVAPLVKPEAVEREVEIKPKTLEGITIMGIMDLVEDDAGEDVIRDLKTAEKKPWKGAAIVSQQLTLYHLIRYVDKKKMPKAGRLVHLVRTPKEHELDVVVQETTRDMEDIKALGARIKTAVEAVEKGVFVPADPAAPGSPCQWCEYADGTCEYVRKVGRPVPKDE